VPHAASVMTNVAAQARCRTEESAREAVMAVTLPCADFVAMR
jgi:hypothetical protein